VQSEFYNQPVVNWARQNLPQPVEIKLRFASRRSRTLIYLLLYLIPLLIVGGLIFLKATGGANETKWWGIFLCGLVLLIPPSIIVLIGVLTRQKLVKSLDAGGVNSSLGRRYLWENLYYVDHVSKITRVGGVSRKVVDNQLELVFAGGKAIIPPLIDDREGIWNLINSMPAQVKDDGAIRSGQPQAPAPAFDEIARMMGELKAGHDRNQ
jgi:hypothetical protein